MTRGLLLIWTILHLISCNTPCDCESIDRTAKDGEMNYKICRYIVEHDLVKQENPCDFKVKEIVNDTLEGKPIYRVILTCCHLGDQAFIDKNTNEVIGYTPADQ